MNTRYFKGYHGNQATTSVELEDTPFTLDITTMKRYNGKLSTTVSTCKKEGMFETHRMYQDFSQTIDSSKVRVTTKEVESQHQRALAKLNEIIVAVKSFYTSTEYVSKYGKEI